MKKNLFALAALGVALIPALASAETAELRVIGTIVPGACAPVFTGGGTVDHGTIFASTLNADAQTRLPEQTIGLTVTCEAPTQMAITLTDERAASVVPGLTTTIAGLNDNFHYGLGASAGGNIGIYALALSGETGDGGAARRIVSTDNGATWAAFGGALAPFATTGRMVSFAAAGGTVPVAFTTVTGNIRVATTIDAAENLDLTNDVPLDGLATLEVTYL
ncbi:DUF1120 domain-containing protein [Luteimonas sp. R10]|uniref:DUF1120 domain-containing protein n=1 Tax=Luteimonas sp. R10 TaxID=3108176 RepID=UPI00308ECAC4|nr:DUF1120 domain-containing protein [Luteimonas sp. R10]